MMIFFDDVFRHLVGKKTTYPHPHSQRRLEVPEINQIFMLAYMYVTDAYSTS